MNHRLIYRPGTAGFSVFGVPDNPAHWHCSCSLGWKFPAQAMPARKTGNNQIEAMRAHELHRQDAP